MKKTNIASNKQVIVFSESNNIVIIGAGNVATHISRHLFSAGHSISCVYSRTREAAERLAEELGSKGTDVKEEVPTNADFFIVCVPDKAVREVVMEFRDRKGTWLHTSGALSLEVFEGIHPQFGVLYPLQTLTRSRLIDPEEIPLLLEGSTAQVAERIKKLASTITPYVQMMNSDSRLMIHMAAVFANNFSNHMVNIAQKILAEQGMDVKLLDPILKETYSKISELNAAESQTGPAIRGDEETMRKHLELLRAHPEWEKLYTFISRDIGRFQND